MNTNNKIIFDYLAFTSTIDSVETLINLLGFQNIDFENCNGFHGYRQRLFFDGIHIHFDGRSDMGICVELSGQGCRNFETLGNGDYSKVFNYIVDNSEVNITRLDVAYDDFDNILDIDLMIDEVRKLNWVSRFRKLTIEEEVSKNRSEDGKCIYFGSKQSECMFRCYDKKIERGRSDIEHWVRFELQLRRDRADCFIDFLCVGNKLSDLFFQVINQYFRFIVHNDSDSNLSRAETAPFWQSFLNSVGKVSLCKPGSEYNLSNLTNFVMKQTAGAVAAFIDLFGIDAFTNYIDFVKEFKLSNKYKLLILQNAGLSLNEPESYLAR